MTEQFSFSFFGLSPSTFLAVFGGIVTTLYLGYRWALPKPIPGIPYNKEAVNNIFGDIGPMVKHIGETRELYNWINGQIIHLQSPIIQLFARPFARPWVLIADFREAQDILLRRTKEFDRSNFFGDVFVGTVPKGFVHMKTNDEFKQHRRWMQDLMTPGFLHQIAAPHIYHACEDLLQLWEEKERLAKDHPFEAARDINRTALDAIWTIAFGADPANSTTKAQLRVVSPLKAIDLPNDADIAAVVPDAPYPAAVESVLTLTDSLETSLKSPVPVIAHWFLRQTPSMKKAYKDKEALIKGEIDKSKRRFEENSKLGKEDKSALDNMLGREVAMAEKEGRAPKFYSRPMFDEIFSFIVAGHDTTATATTWALKILADNHGVQDRLRSELRSGYSSATAESRNPTIQEITKTTIHYLDAVMEEIIRCSLTEAWVIRTALVDVEVLGHHIPKGTDVFFMGNGPSIFSPAFQIEESLRSESCRTAKGRIGSWDPKDMAVFNPDRWLVEENGKKVFDPAAGPHLTFGLGPRGCWGRRLSYVELRMFLVMIIWNFELQKCPQELSSYKAVDKLTHAPVYCYVKPRRLT